MPSPYGPRRDDAVQFTQSGPRFFGPTAHPIFGWYHAPEGRRRNEAVVLCHSVGQEYMVAYRMMRVLAERLAADGFAVLRFDWPGTGDSAGDMGDPRCATGSVAVWGDALRRAVERARTWSGSGRVSVVGLRGGALLAASETVGADRLVLWWPPSSGRQFLRELRARHALADLDHDRYSPVVGDYTVAPGSVESDGFLIAPGLAAELGALAFASGGPTRARETLLVAPAQGAEGPAATALRERGVEVDVERAEGNEMIRRSTLEAELPVEAIAGIVRWLGAKADAAAAPGGQGGQSDHATAAAPDLDEIAGAGAAAVDGAREECVRFGLNARMVGVLTTPTARPLAEEGARRPVLLLHTGGNHRVGANRMWPVWARRWAREGITTLRFDAAGLGDTPAVPGAEGAMPDAYGEGRTAEVVAAARYLCERTGVDAVDIVGVCSGGYYAVRGAAAGAPAAGVIAVNPQFYAGHDDIDHSIVAGHRAPTLLGMAVRDPARWRRVLRGETRASAVAQMVWHATRRALHATGTIALQEVRRMAVATRVARRGPRTGALADLWRTAQLGVPLYLVFSQEDEGWAYLRVQARAAWRAFRRRHEPRVHVIDRATHTFVRPWMQQSLFDTVSAELRRR